MDTQVAQLHLLRIMACYRISVDEAVDKLLIDFKDEADIGNIILARDALKGML